jgi:hypothetical protein
MQLLHCDRAQRSRAQPNTLRTGGRAPRPVREVADILLAGHSSRRRNPGAADLLLAGGGLEMVYDRPDEEDRTRTLVISLWPKR